MAGKSAPQLGGRGPPPLRVVEEVGTRPNRQQPPPTSAFLINGCFPPFWKGQRANSQSNLTKAYGRTEYNPQRPDDRNTTPAMRHTHTQPPDTTQTSSHGLLTRSARGHFSSPVPPIAVRALCQDSEGSGTKRAFSCRISCTFPN